MLGTDYISGDKRTMYDACEQYIEESLWAFRPEWLKKYMFDLGGEELNVLAHLQEKCEGGNDAVKALIGWDDCSAEFTADAIAAEKKGMGHFLNHYDGSTLEKEVNGTEYYACRN